MVARFNALADRGIVDFEAWFNERSHTDRSWRVAEDEWRFRARYLPKRRTPIGELPIAQAALKEFRPDVLISLFAEPAFMLGWARARRTPVKTGFRVMAPSPAIHPRHPLKEAAKRYMFRRASALLVPGPDAHAYARSYGVPEERIMRESQVIDARFFAAATERERAGRVATRERLGLRGVTFLYVGRLLRTKGLFELIEAFRTVATSVEASLLLVGDGIDEHELKAAVERLDASNVIFAGFHEPAKLPAFMAASDVFVFPTYGDAYGLVVDEAMAAGLPVISSTAAGEIRERVLPDHTGLLVEPASAAGLATAMKRLADDPSARAGFGTAARGLIAGSSPAIWAEDIERAASQIAGTP